MYCEVCKQIPLDIFLPSLYHTRRGQQAQYHGSVQYSKDVPGGQAALDRLNESAASGCEVCQLLKSTLDNSGLPEGVGIAAKPNNLGLRLDYAYQPDPSKLNHPGEPGIMLELDGEGKVLVHDGTRSGILNWTIPSLNTGYKRSQAIASSSSALMVWAQCRSWLDTCEQTHKFCLESTLQYTPHKLIQIERVEEALHVQLVQLKDVRVKYAALSYCWGQGQKIVPTDGDNYFGRELLIHWEELCPTHRDAIRLTAELGLKYIWIDVLCTLQDQPEDVEAHWVDMDRIFKGAYVTLAASSTGDPSQDILTDRNPVVVSGLKLQAKNNRWVIKNQSIMSGHLGRDKGNPDEAEVIIYPALRPWMHSIQGPLSKRAWTLQERELSPRVLHFTAERVLWECRECFAAEEEPEMMAKAQYDKTVSLSLSPLRSLDSNGRNTPTKTSYLLSIWLGLMQAYSRRKLSVATDKLIAIAGLATEFASCSSNERYLAGCWQSNLLESLSWFPDDTIATSNAQATLENALDQLSLTTEQGAKWPPAQADPGTPSWSWASYDGMIWFWGTEWYKGGWQNETLANGETKYVKKNDSAKIMESQVNNKPAQYGPVAGGSVLMLGQAIQVHLSEAHFDADVSKGWIRKVYVVKLSSTTEPVVKESQRRRALELAGMELYATSLSQDSKSEEETPVPTTNVSIYFDQDPKELPSGQFLCFKLGNGKPPRGGKPDKDCGLVLIQSKDSESFQRVGMFDVLANDEIWIARRAMKEVEII